MATILAAVMACQRVDATSPRLASSRISAASTDLSTLAGSVRTDTVLVLERIAPLEHDLTVSKVIGPDGGTLALKAAGASLRIPKGALPTTATISMTAKAGIHVAYEFEPHGTKFAVALVVRQNPRHTQAVHSKALTRSLRGSYYEGDLSAAFVDPAHLFARIRELRPTTVDDDGHKLTFTTAHFSGYLLSSGRALDTGDQ